MKSFKQFIFEEVARRPDKISVSSLEKSGSLKPDETGYINITSYHGGNFGEAEGEQLTPSHIKFSTLETPNQMSRSELRGKILTPSQPISSFVSFSTTPDAAAAITYRGSRYQGREKLYEVGMRVHKDNIKHFHDLGNWNSFFNGEDSESPFHQDSSHHEDWKNHLFNHPKHGSMFKEYHETLNKLRSVRENINQQHNDWVNSLPPVESSNDHEEDYDLRKKRMNLIDQKHTEMLDNHPEYKLLRQRHLTNRENISKAFSPNATDVHNLGIDPVEFAHAKMKHDFIVNKLGIHAITLKTGSGRAFGGGEIHALNPSVIQSVTDRTEQIDAIRDKYARIRSSPAYERLIGPVKVGVKVARRHWPASAMGQRIWERPGFR